MSISSNFLLQKWVSGASYSAFLDENFLARRRYSDNLKFKGAITCFSLLFHDANSVLNHCVVIGQCVSPATEWLLWSHGAAYAVILSDAKAASKLWVIIAYSSLGYVSVTYFITRCSAVTHNATTVVGYVIGSGHVCSRYSVGKR